MSHPSLAAAARLSKVLSVTHISAWEPPWSSRKSSWGDREWCSWPRQEGEEGFCTLEGCGESICRAALSSKGPLLEGHKWQEQFSSEGLSIDLLQLLPCAFSQLPLTPGSFSTLPSHCFKRNMAKC